MLVACSSEVSHPTELVLYNDCIAGLAAAVAACFGSFQTNFDGLLRLLIGGLLQSRALVHAFVVFSYIIFMPSTVGCEYEGCLTAKQLGDLHTFITTI